LAIDNRFIHRLLQRLISLVSIVLAGGLLCATLVRFSPGFGADERELNSELSSASIAVIRNSHSRDQPLIGFYGNYLRQMTLGNLGMSQTFQRPIVELVLERSSVSFRSLATALPAAWLLVLFLSLAVTAFRNRFSDVFPSVVAGGLLAMPAAMIALWAAGTGHGVTVALILVLSPALYRYVRNIMERSFHKAHVMAARARGVGIARIMFWHVLPIAAPQVVGLVAVSLSMAFGALIPVEFICDSPGFGQLALQAALGRDLPLVVTLTMIITVVTYLANMAADTLNDSMTPVSE
jgi:peptide/nickel transport system permease protein